MKYKKYIMAAAAAMGIMALTGCDKENVADVPYELTSQMVTANYSCEDAQGETIFGSRMECELELKESADEKTMLQLADQCARKAEEEQGNEIIEIEAVFQLPDGKKETYLLRGKDQESLVTDSGEYQDWR